jgi:uncharacterized protein YjiS (DUF1127 family)
MKFVKKINHYLTERIRYKVTMNELGALSDRELTDIGINRCDIPRVAQQNI